MNRRRVTIPVLGLLLAQAVTAAEFHVAPNGNDANPGTKAQAFATIQAGVNKLQPGDRLLILGGVYRETGLVVGGHDNAFLNSTIRYSAGAGLYLSGYRHTVHNCLIDEIDYASHYLYALQVNSQEFDIFEDFSKPKNQDDIQHCYHCSAVRGFGTETAATGYGDYGKASEVREVVPVSAPKKVILEEYAGWHTVGFQWTPLEHIFFVDGQETFRINYREVPVTTVPQKVWISSCLRVPPDKDAKPLACCARAQAAKTKKWR